MQTIFELAISSLIVLISLLVITTRNPIYAVFYLILVFIGVAFLLILLDLDFLGMIFLIVYIGAIAILFLFVVMMLNVNISELFSTKDKFSIGNLAPIAGSFLALLFLVILFLISNVEGLSFFSDVYDSTVSYSSTLLPQSSLFVLSQHLYSTFSFHLILASLVLLVAMIGAIHLALTKRNR